MCAIFRGEEAIFKQSVNTSPFKINSPNQVIYFLLYVHKFYAMCNLILETINIRDIAYSRILLHGSITYSY